MKSLVKKLAFSSVILAAFLLLWAKVFLPPLMTSKVESRVAREWLTPLDTGRRHDWNSLLISKEGGFLAERPAYKHLSSHVHTGTDIQNKRRGGPGEPIFAVAKGKIYDVKLQEQGTRVTIQHLLASGELVYTSYIHVADVRVKKGMRVDPSTVIARRFNKEELKQYGAFYNHLHFQVHKNRFVAEHTIDTQTPEKAQERFYDPQWIFYHHDQEMRPDWRQWLREKKISFWKLLWVVLIFQLTRT